MDITHLLKKLPEELKAQLSSEKVMHAITQLEQKTGLGLTVPVIEIVAGQMQLQDYLQTQGSELTNEQQQLLQSGLESIMYMLNVGSSSSASVNISTPVVASNAVLPPTPTSPATVFSTDDDAEINQYKNSTTAGMTTDYERLADALIVEFGYTTSEEVLRKRLKNNIVARLRGVRDNLEAREVLEKSKKIGGLEFTPEQASALLQLIARKMPKVAVETAANVAHITFPTQRPFAISSRISLQEKKQNTPTIAPVTPVIAPQIIAPEPEPIVLVTAKPIVPKVDVATVQPIIEEEDGLPVIRYASPKQVASGTVAPNNSVKSSLQPPETEVPVRTEAVVASVKSSQPIIASVEAPVATVVESGAVARPEMPLPQPQPYAPTTPPVKPQAVTSRKPSLDGVKLVKQSVGPIDELSGMTLIDFRRLSADPQVAVDKVFAKIELLTADGYGKRLEGITAWRMSEVSKFYRLLGQASLNNHQSVEEVIADRLKTEKPTLSLAEFEAVMSLNEKLRY